jgi:hypothetical protein
MDGHVPFGSGAYVATWLDEIVKVFVVSTASPSATDLKSA